MLATHIAHELIRTLSHVMKDTIRNQIESNSFADKNTQKTSRNVQKSLRTRNKINIVALAKNTAN